MCAAINLNDSKKNKSKKQEKGTAGVYLDGSTEQWGAPLREAVSLQAGSIFHYCKALLIWRAFHSAQWLLFCNTHWYPQMSPALGVPPCFIHENH